MITRRGVSLATGIGLLGAHRLSPAQSSAAIRRVGILYLSSEASTARLSAEFAQGMLDFGWREGKDVEYRFAAANGDVDHLDVLASELVGQKVDVIVTGSTYGTRAAQRATRTIPIVMAGGSTNVVENGFVASLAKPGGNITGINSLQEDALGKLIEILHAVIPSARRIAIVLNEGSPSHTVYWAAAQSACAAFDLIALRVVASAPAQLGSAVEQIVRERSQAVVVVSDAMYFAERVKLQELMYATRLPVGYQLNAHVVAGGLLSYGYDIGATFRYAAKYVDKILKGAKPADLPVEQPTKFDLVINLKTAKSLGITIPQSVLLRADEVIK